MKLEKPEEFSGFLLINKPVGPTSHDVISRLRKITGIKKIGHAGTLDPLAEGLLLVAIGRQATKNIQQFVGLDKQYLAEIKLGEETDTYDREGQILKKYQGPKIEKKIIKNSLQKFLGEQKQMPPMYSAKQVAGQRLYVLARQHKTIDRPTSLIKINKLKLKKYQWPLVTLLINCSSGTYIRSLAYDLGLELGCGAYLYSLQRTKIGNYKLKKAQHLTALTTNNWQKFCWH